MIIAHIQEEFGILPVVVTIFWTNTPAFCRLLRLKFSAALEPEDAEETGAPVPWDACRGVMGTGVDWTGLTLATGFSSDLGGGRLTKTSIVWELNTDVTTNELAEVRTVLQFGPKTPINGPYTIKHPTVYPLLLRG